MDKIIDIDIPIYDQCETIEGCTVEILTNSVTGQSETLWWRGGKDDAPMFGRNEDGETC